MIFFKNNSALYSVKFTAIPTKAFISHRLRLDINFFLSDGATRMTLKSLLPIFMFVSGMEGESGYPIRINENANFTEYRRGVLRGKGSDEFWIMAERVLREYTA